VIDAVLGFKIVGIGRRPMLIQRRTDSLLLCGLTWLRFRFHFQLPSGIKPGMPVFTTSFSLYLDECD
jgi:hypothetical protein